MLPRKAVSKILREKFLIQYSRNIGHLTSFDVSITAHVIRPTAELFVDSGHREMNRKNLAWFNEGNMIPL